MATKRVDEYSTATPVDADQVVGIDASDMTDSAAGTVKRFVLSDLLTYIASNVSLAASKITSGALALARGGTNADLSATGGAGQVLKQASSGAAITVGTVPFSDIASPPTTLAGYGITDAASDSELATHEADTTSVHGITDTSTLYRSGGTDVALADGGTGASLTDPNADRILFWDDSAGATTWLTPGSGLTIADTTITVSGAVSVLNTNATAVANVGTGEDNLITYSVPGGTLGTNGEYLHWTATGQFGASANTKRIRAYLGTTVLFDTSALAITVATDWSLEGEILRVDGTNARSGARFTSSSATLAGFSQYAAPTETLANALTLKLTGEATANDDITQRALLVEKYTASGALGALAVKEIDGSPSVANVTEIKVTNGTLIDNGNGSVTVTTGGGYTQGARVYNSAAISVSNGVDTVMTFDTEAYDTDTMHSTVSNTGRLTCNTAGKYLIVGNVRWDTSSASYRYAAIRLNGTTFIALNIVEPASASVPTEQIVTTIYDLAANDYVELIANQGTGGALDAALASPRAPAFMAQRIG